MRLELLSQGRPKMRQLFAMTEDDLATLLEACKPTRVMKIGSYTPNSPQENANAAWRRLGDKMGFDHMTVQPSGSSQLNFTAVPKDHS